MGGAERGTRGEGLLGRGAWRGCEAGRKREGFGPPRSALLQGDFKEGAVDVARRLVAVRLGSGEQSSQPGGDPGPGDSRAAQGSRGRLSRKGTKRGAGGAEKGSRQTGPPAAGVASLALAGLLCLLLGPCSVSRPCERDEARRFRRRGQSRRLSRREPRPD